MILRLLKKEYSSEELATIMNNFDVARNEDNVLTIAGDFNELNTIMSGKTMPETIYRRAFSEYKNENEKLQFTNELISTTRKAILNNLLLIASKGVWTEEARELYNYLNK